ncbi:3-hydroxy-3-methylglutaryl-coenzyme A (HMG-CoA) reductase isozyme [Orbilia oligospora]|uniref:3-hydroxy-3-methylglutaryl coenzyme A reductase n=1 Tax=Orbilia oligospora TaxID=2813651 RepID=A0A7C8N1T1_ORBOL|nr:3-hydroxy-3-methylglutaryl-coenzyme A (HMG-CoA) reductase isozyme [Orbilia oligospora]KAF3085586.1 3-hydroxy-3-methylglutaryl-coenzyme A (HMG-CoA) reductase isozyme [Orbilia oligospora]KAF3092213.1 3-hydroxy-3-methylglutaryl-coenzyme A (HMG-CoA) reductase isozyme [Orbilia oligospora]KAF3120856.1 3-hydroxy-3-methylglutaryl-coenzyme A (HMG-CoA) reductase isozyme [Orbilia oligospora]KAF3121746.1 3-hydroxy-3-methylglutaryl-coenzyme A (HMG-CoA) reductase isozyme [Orbilia oligospora]
MIIPTHLLPTGPPKGFPDPFTPIFSPLSKRATAHPIHTIVAIALLASATYVALLEVSLFGTGSDDGLGWGFGGNDWTKTALNGAATVQLSQKGDWEEVNGLRQSEAATRLSLVTLSFPPSQPHQSIAAPSNVSSKPTVKPLPVTSSNSLAFSVPYEETTSFLSQVGVISTGNDINADGIPNEQQIFWVAQEAGGKSISDNSLSALGLVGWVKSSWESFTGLIKNAESLDIAIMAFGYLSMHSTFVSLFLSMRRLGSNFWLATTVLFSSGFAFFFACFTTHRLGVPINLILLSEGLPFLVVIVGFEKPIILTKAVLEASAAQRRKAIQNQDRNKGTSIQTAVSEAVQQVGFSIVRDFVIEIAILALGAASSIQGGFRRFCFLALWILVFDCILLFTFYTAILSLKLEINRIKRHVALRKALEDDGVSRRVAESVARENDWPKIIDKDGNLISEDELSKDKTTNIFGRKVKDSNIKAFKVLSVACFLFVNILNTVILPFREHSATSVVTPITPSQINALAIAKRGLESIAESAAPGTIVEVLHPVIFRAVVHDDSSLPFPNTQQNSNLFTEDAVGSRVMQSLLKSLEDPILSKWVFVVLAMSIVLNGYLFNAARWSVKDTHVGEVEAPAPVRAMPPPPPAPVPKTYIPIPEIVNTEAPSEKPTGDRKDISVLTNILKSDPKELTDTEVLRLCQVGKLPIYALEKQLKDTSRAVAIRRRVVAGTKSTIANSQYLAESKLPQLHYDYDRVLGACCENVIGYLPLPVGVAGPLVIDGESYWIPMATTEGVLVASTHRGCKSINAGGGVTTVITGDGMTRGPCVSFASLARAGAAKLWLDSEEGQKVMKDAFNSTSRFARLQTIKCALAGTYLYIRFKTTTGDAMGMNMISKGVEHALSVMANDAGFDDMEIISVSGNYCTDKKPAAINWIEGRGKSVVAEAIIPKDTVENTLKITVDALIELNISKNFIGSAMAGSVGGFNAHAANIVAAVFLATGQDPAQVVESANCITVMRKVNGNLQISVSMPSIEVGTIGGGTILEPQGAMLDLLGVRGPHPTTPGTNAQQLARIVAGAVLAGELSLCSALAAGHLVRSHMQHNRSAAPTRSSTPAVGNGSANGGLVMPAGLTMTRTN